MTAREFFEQAFRINELIDSKAEMIRMLRDRAEKVTTALSPMKVQNSGSGRTMADTLDLIADMEAELNEDTRALFATLKTIIAVIRRIPDKEYQLILEKKYISGKTYPEIARDMNYSESTVMRMHEKALAAAEIPNIDGD